MCLYFFTFLIGSIILTGISFVLNWEMITGQKTIEPNKYRYKLYVKRKESKLKVDSGYLMAMLEDNR